jgi:N-acetylated-alpha-linked acidic dipeptidase
MPRGNTASGPVTLILGIGLWASGTLAGPAAADGVLLGYSPEGTAAEKALEAKFDSILQADNLRQSMKRMTAHPHNVGSPYDKEMAEWIAGQFRAWGYETSIEEFDILFPTPKLRLLEMTAPESFMAKLAEPPVAGDSTSGLTQEELPTYNAYSIDGDVTGELVYVNQGVPKDYETLAARGISVQGKIVLARYGGSWRGIKPKVAAEHGAIGCIIFSDPREEGYFEGDVYPKGPWQNANTVQRGSVADIPVAPGDPLTPGIGATKEAKRLPIDQASTLTKIPVLPISSADAEPLLRAIGGTVAPDLWRGALPLTYHLGPGPAKVHLKVQFNWQTVPAYDVLARWPGAERPDEWVIRGNHHDAWVFGAEDPVSGTVALLEEARAISELAKSGWKPKRTLLYAAWDAEEPGLIGSTEWVETHGDELLRHAVAYINGDDNQRGFLRVGGSHTLEKLMGEVAQSVIDPETKVSVGERAHARALVTAGPEERRDLRDREGLRVRALGSGSDYSPFLQHAGIAVLDIRYSGEGEGGSYHSIYDSFDYYTRFIDPTFAYGVALAQTAGRAVLRLANADILPFEFTRFAETLDGYVQEITKLADELRRSTEEQNRLINDRTLHLAADPTEPFHAPPPKAPVPYFNFAPLQNVAERIRDAAHSFDNTSGEVRAGRRMVSLDVQKQLDQLLMGMEHLLTQPEGLPRRPWYRHVVYAPGFYTGYAVKTLPGVREAIEERHWEDVETQVSQAAKALAAFALQIEKANRLLETIELKK